MCWLHVYRPVETSHWAGQIAVWFFEQKQIGTIIRVKDTVHDALPVGNSGKRKNR